MLTVLEEYLCILPPTRISYKTPPRLPRNRGKQSKEATTLWNFPPVSLPRVTSSDHLTINRATRAVKRPQAFIQASCIFSLPDTGMQATSQTCCTLQMRIKKKREFLFTRMSNVKLSCECRHTFLSPALPFSVFISFSYRSISIASYALFSSRYHIFVSDPVHMITYLVPCACGNRSRTHTYSLSLVFPLPPTISCPRFPFGIATHLES